MSTPGGAVNAHEMPLLEELLAASSLGLYFTDHAIIRLSHDASFWVEDNEPTLDRLAVFIHEYAHYLHNFSTGAGVYGFIATLRLLALFMSTVGEDGASIGSTALAPEAAAEFDGVARWRRHIAGAQLAPMGMASISWSDLQVGEIKRISENIPLASQILDVKSANVTLKLGRSETAPVADFALGAHVLMEGLAWEIERVLFISEGRGAAQLDITVPAWPYKIPRVIFEQVAGTALSSEMMAKVLLLALQSTDPGDAFIELAQVFKDNVEGRSHAEIVGALQKTVCDFLSAKKESLFSAWKLDADRFSSRPPLHRAFTAMLGWAREYLELRTTSPFFEVDLVSTTDRNALVGMLKAFPPCPIIQETGPLSHELELILLSEQSPDQGQVQDLAIAQSLLHFAARHIGAREIVPTSRAQEGACRFWGACKLPLTSSAPQICQRRPWESFKPADAECCWYASAVRISRSVKRAS